MSDVEWWTTFVEKKIDSVLQLAGSMNPARVTAFTANKQKTLQFSHFHIFSFTHSLTGNLNAQIISRFPGVAYLLLS